MRKTTLTSIFALTLSVAFGVVAAGDEPTEVWNDPEFKKAFLGAYGIHPDVEPRMTAEERTLLEKVYPLMSSDPAEAERQVIAAQKPDSTALFDFVLGGLSYQQERPEDAAIHYEAAVTKFPSFRRAWKMLGLVQYRLQKPDASVAAFTKLIQLGGGDAISYGLLGDAFSSRQDHLAAEAAYRNALLLDPDNANYRIGLVRAVLKQEKYQEAIGLLRVLIEKNPDRPEFWLLQAHAYVNLKQPLEAAENYEVVSRMGKATAESMNVLGDIYVNENLPNLAWTAYARAIDLDSGRSLTRPRHNVESLLARGAPTEAALLLTKLREVAGDTLDEDSRRALLKLDARIAIAAGKGEEASRVLEEVVTLDPLDGDALMLLGQHYQRAGDLDRALLYYERAGSVEAFEAQAKMRQGQLLASQGKYDKALPLLKRSMELKPTEQLRLYIEQVERLARTGR